MPYVLGVDGGNTKTVALIASLDGTILGAGRGGCGDIYNASAGPLWPDSASAAVANIEYTVNAALDAAGILDFYKLETVEELLHLFTNRLQRHQYRIDQLTPLLLDAAQAGDNAATHIVQEQGAMLGKYALAAARKVGIEGTAFTLVLAGGVFRHPSQLLANAIIETVRTTSPA